MKRVISLLLAVIMTVISFNFSVFAESFDSLETENNLSSVIDGKNAPENMRLNYLVVTDPSLSINKETNTATEQICIGIGNEELKIQSAKLTYNKIGDETLKTVSAASIDDNGIIFNIDFSSDDKGTYTITYLDYEIDGINYNLKFSDIDMGNIVFGVETEVISEPDAYVVDKESAQTIDQNELGEPNISIARINENGDFTKNNDIDTAINQEISLKSQMRSLTSELSSGYKTVVLDPGHGGSDSGAIHYENGRVVACERDINLKIAQYCKTELEKYNNVKVYMTRYDNGSNPSLSQRVQTAKNYGANLLVSIHCNSFVSNTAHGAEVWYPNSSSYNYYIHENGANVSRCILDQLSSLGIYNRGIKTKDATDGETYPDGHISDYFTLVNVSRRNGIVGIIVEHAFISSQSDYNNYLSSDSNLQKLGVADATGIAKYFGLSKANVSTSLANGTYMIAPLSSVGTVIDGYDKNNTRAKSENRSSAQLFNVSKSGSSYKIINLNSNLSLTANGSNISLSNYSANNFNQQWTLYEVPNTGAYYVTTGNRYLTENYGGLFSWDSLSNKNQQFIFIPVSDNIGNKSCILASRLDTNQVVDIRAASKSSGANCQLYEENHTNAQIFNFKYSNGYYTIENTGSKKLLDVQRADTENFTNVQQYDSNGTNAQKWILIKNNDATYSLMSRCNGLLMDVYSAHSANWTNIDVYRQNGTDAQKFILINASSAPIAEGTYFIVSALNNGNSTLDIRYAETGNGVNVQLWERNNTPAQKFKFQKTDYGYYKIISECSGKVLDVHSAGFYNKTNLQQYTDNGTNAQKWIIEKNSDSTYTLISRCNGKCIDIASANTANGTNAQLYESNSTAAQKFILKSSYDIMDNTKTTVDKMVNLYQHNTNYTYKQYLTSLGSNTSKAPSSLREFCQLYVEECSYEGVKAEVAFSQAMVETGWLRYSGDVNPTQFNFAGLGATGNGAKGLSFESARIGIRAQIQHLKAYASTDNLNLACVDPRFKYVKRGCAPSVYGLSGTWAADKTYGGKIAKLMDMLV